MRRDYKAYVDDIADAIANIEGYTPDLDFDEETLTEFNKWSIGK